MLSFYFVTGSSRLDILIETSSYQNIKKSKKIQNVRVSIYYELIPDTLLLN